ncbi:proline--tRNA ligase [Candidatus Micrarchaeota archaeon]|nr:proline--tRNA ligase [Candidatus Micrarchaeota archaeon]
MQMKQREFKIDKETNFSEWYNTIIYGAELADIRYNVKGFVVFRPWAVAAMKRMYAAYEKELEKTGHGPAWFPALIPEKNLMKEAKHVEGFVPEVFWVEKAGETKLEERLAMRPTSETAMYPMYALWIQSASDLPLKIYHSSQVWRHETKATKPFIRSREFYWIEAHDVYATREESEAQVREDMQIARKVITQKLGVPFVFFQRPQWDKFPGALHTFAADTLMPDGKVIQQPSTHLLGQNFSKAFDISFTDEKGNKQFGWQTCYGPAISRIYASVISMHGDSKGLVLPPIIAPIQIVIVPIARKGSGDPLVKKALQIKEALEQKDWRVHIDSRDKTPGFKFNDWEMKGVPMRIEMGERELEKLSVTLALRDSGEKRTVLEKDLEKRVMQEAEAMTKRMLEKAEKWFTARLNTASTEKDLVKRLDKGGMVRIPFCTLEMNGMPCAESLKKKHAIDVRGTRYDQKEKPSGKETCVMCGKTAAVYVFAGRQY